MPPYSIYIGDEIALQITKFKNDYYLCFGKEEDDGLVKPFINISLRYVEPEDVALSPSKNILTIIIRVTDL